MAFLKKINFFDISLIFSFIFFSIYFLMPILNYDFFSIYILFFIIFYSLYFCKNVDINLDEDFQYMIFLLPVSMFFFIYIITSAEIFHSNKYYNLIQSNYKIIEKEFSKDISPVDIKQIRTVDQLLAKKLGEKKLGEDLALGSIVDVGTFNIQLVNNKLYWVAPLVHKGFFKWLTNNGTPGYIKVSATNDNDVELVLNKGKIVYQPNSFFSENLHRFVYFSGFMSSGITDFTFEIDEEGKPFWVITKYKKTIGFKGEEAVGVIVVDATNGNIKEYDIKNTPKWIDRIQPEEFIKEQLNNYGAYKLGWFNYIFAGKDVMKTTKGMALVYGNNGEAYWYTGITSNSNDGSTIGFMLVNTKNKKVYFYKISGATEDRAMKSAEGMVQEKNYNATFPILYNVLGIPTYILTLKDKEGLVKNIAMVNVKNYSIVGIGSNIKEALRKYKSKLLSNKNINLNSDISLKNINNATIDRINFDLKNGNSYYYFTIKEVNNKIFILDSSLSEEVVLTKGNDKVSIKYEDSNNSYINISKFDNLMIN